MAMQKALHPRDDIDMHQEKEEKESSALNGQTVLFDP